MFSISIFKQCLERKKRTKEDHIRHGKSLSRIILVHQGMPKSPLSIFIRPKGSHRNTIKSLTQAITRARKEKGPKYTTHFRCPMENCSPYWSKTMGFLSLPQDQKDLYIRKDTILMPDVSTTRVRGHSTENCMTFRSEEHTSELQSLV